MTIPASPLPRNDYLGNNTTPTYAFGFTIYETSNLLVTTRSAAGVESTLIYPTDYSIAGVNVDGGGSITLTAGNLASGVALSIVFDDDVKQPTDIKNQGSLFLSAIEKGLDLVTRFVQMIEDRVNRSVRLPVTEAGTEAATVVPTLALRKNKFMAWDNNGNITPAAGTSASLGPVSAFIDTLLPAVDAATARNTLGLNVDAAGDIYVATADNVIARMAVGAENGMLLGVDLSQTNKLLYMHPPVENPIINGNFDIWQRGTAFASIGHVYTADRWYYVRSLSVGQVTVNRSTDVPTVAQAGVLFNYSLEVDVTTVDAAIGAGDGYALRHAIEGYNWRPFAQRALAVSFWVNSSKTGVHCLGASNGGFDRSFVAEYTVNAANTWEHKTVPILASPSAGTWDYTSGIGLDLRWALAYGSTFQTTAGAWQVGQFWATANQVNCLDSTANYFRIAGVKLELGSVATPIQYIPFEEELFRCKRYYQKSFLYATTPAQNVGANTGEFTFTAPRAGALTQTAPTIPLSPPMRITPATVTMYNPGAANFQLRDQIASADCSGSGITGRSESSLSLSAIGNASTAVGNTLAAHWTASAEL